MKTLVICNSLAKKNTLFSFCSDYKLQGNNITVGMFASASLDPKTLKDNEVLVHIKAFSCNYRDRGLMLEFSNKCNAETNISKIVYSPFGSDFVAEVIGIGAKSELKIGDRVIPNCSYTKANHKSRGGIPSNFASQRLQVFEDSRLCKIPKLMTDEVASAFTIISQTAYSIIRKLNLRGGENILITAATSNTSLAIINALKNKNVCISAMTNNPIVNIDTLKTLGVDEVFSLSDLKQKKSVNKFDIVIDPFFDLHLIHVIDYMNFESRYITCGLYAQNPNFKNYHTTFKQNYFHTLVTAIQKNIMILGNCLGTESDLQNAIKDFENGAYKLLIDSVHSGSNIVPFLEKSFGNIPKLGKIVYKY